MKKILFFVESLSGGGAEKVLTDLVANLDKTKYDVTVSSLVNIGVYNDLFKEICNYKYILQNPKKSGFISKKLYFLKYKAVHKLSPRLLHKLFFKDTYDIEVAFIEGFSTKIISASSNNSSKKIAWVHIDLFENHWTKIEYRNLEEEIAAYKRYDTIACVSNSVKTSFSKRFGIKDKVITRYNPVNRQDILNKAKAPIHIMKDKNVVNLVTVGRLEHQKGYDRLLKIVIKLKLDGLKFHIRIVGDGSQKIILQEYILKHNIQDCVSLLGFQNNPYKYINDADVFVCSSRSEGFSTVITEALILGKAIITTKCSGMEELLANNEYGIITKNDSNALYEGLKTFLKNDSLREHYTQKSIERGKDFDLLTIMKNIEEVL